jgi:hypothetical protein
LIKLLLDLSSELFSATYYPGDSEINPDGYTKGKNNFELHGVKVQEKLKKNFRQ